LIEVSALPIITGLSGLVIGVIGGVLTHVLSVRRDIAVKRRELILHSLITALEELDRTSSDRPDADLKQLEKVIFRINIVGDRDLVELARTVVIDISNPQKGSANTTPLYNALRARIRKELKLPKIPDGYMGLVVRYPGDNGFEQAKKAWSEFNRKTEQ
jgi:hypothetical protein